MIKREKILRKSFDSVMQFLSRTVQLLHVCITFTETNEKAGTSNLNSVFFLDWLIQIFKSLCHIKSKDTLYTKMTLRVKAYQFFMFST